MFSSFSPSAETHRLVIQHHLNLTIMQILRSDDLWMLFTIMVIIKALSYALSSPAREMLYSVTSDAIKFKAKSWIDVFGAHGAKVVLA